MATLPNLQHINSHRSTARCLNIASVFRYTHIVCVWNTKFSTYQFALFRGSIPQFHVCVHIHTHRVCMTWLHYQIYYISIRTVLRLDAAAEYISPLILPKTDTTRFMPDTCPLWFSRLETRHPYYKWVMSHIWMSLTYMSESCHTHEWVMPHTWMSHVTHMNESCHTHEWDTTFMPLLRPPSDTAPLIFIFFHFFPFLFPPPIPPLYSSSLQNLTTKMSGAVADGGRSC